MLRKLSDWTPSPPARPGVSCAPGAVSCAESPAFGAAIKGGLDRQIGVIAGALAAVPGGRAASRFMR